MSKKEDTSSAIKLIADAAAEASKTIAAAAAEALKVKREESSGDHDLIIQLNTKVDQIQADVTTLKTQDKNNITQEQHQALVTCNLDHETRIRNLEEFKQNWLGKVSVVGAVASVIVSALFVLVEHLVK
jgi:NADH dehydrogenase FAD-containing subunit